MKHSVIIDGQLTVGKFVRGYSYGTTKTGRESYRAEWDGYYVGSWMDEGMLYHYFENGHIRDSVQRVHGFPASQVVTETSHTVVPVGTEMTFGGQRVRITDDGAHLI